jgi:hypothetical protein
VDIYPYEYNDFLKVLTHLCGVFGLIVPPVVDILDGYAADLYIDGVEVKMLMDNWTFSLASEREQTRDRIFASLDRLGV